jgi:hypothetical protein
MLSLVNEQLPVRALLTSIPMLSALEQAVQGNFGKHADVQRLNIIREVLARVWLVIGKVWDCQPLVEAAEQVLCPSFAEHHVISTNTLPKTLNAVPYPSNLPARPHLQPGVLTPPREPIEFSGETLSLNGLMDGVVVEHALAALSANRNVQEVTGLDSDKLLPRLSKKWTAEQALKDCK